MERTISLKFIGGSWDGCYFDMPYPPPPTWRVPVVQSQNCYLSASDFDPSQSPMLQVDEYVYVKQRFSEFSGWSGYVLRQNLSESQK